MDEIKLGKGSLRTLNRAKKSDAEKARKLYSSWRRDTKESKIYMAVLFAMCEGVCPKCNQPMYLDFTDNMKGNKATLDHITPLSLVKQHSKFGLQIMCHDCNSKKGSELE